jgi:hypothetical protein
MPSKKNAKLNGKPDMPKQVPLPLESVSAAPIRARGKSKPIEVEPPKPKREYELGNFVACAQAKQEFGSTNCRVAGYEWGANHRKFNRDVWLYYLAPADRDLHLGMILIPEDEIHGRISV